MKLLRKQQKKILLTRGKRDVKSYFNRSMLGYALERLETPTIDDIVYIDKNLTKAPTAERNPCFLSIIKYKRIRDTYGISVRKMERLCKKLGWEVKRRSNLYSTDDFQVRINKYDSLLCIKHDDKLINYYRDTENSKLATMYKPLEDFEGEYYDPSGLEEEIINDVMIKTVYVPSKDLSLLPNIENAIKFAKGDDCIAVMDFEGVILDIYPESSSDDIVNVYNVRKEHV